MKYFFTIALLVIITLSQANAQQPFVKSYIERTHISPKLGLQGGYEFKNNFELGGFYQKENDAFWSSNEAKPRFYEKEFYGVIMAAPVLSKEKFNVKANVRMGAVNGEYFSITPSMIAGYKLFNAIEVQAGFGLKSFRITSQAGIRFNLNN
ncbi:hypothetical protein [Marinoscillum sp. MHG1-6]|uniref:hypothetical protein n=1 Tax=Marinoscillum sp. MHG1-6 TaxID=2959627 RepID=UPI00215706E4|nr:hypothetical protein [Marinoscillum sp. MHG1-6]